MNKWWVIIIKGNRDIFEEIGSWRILVLERSHPSVYKTKKKTKKNQKKMIKNKDQTKQKKTKVQK